tara:strand:- start:5 stop:385 length:381 start_codon:yes stop_codon:yes gene_type:complete
MVLLSIVRNKEMIMNNEMTALIENIKADYLNWTTRCAGAKGRTTLSDTNKDMIARFNDKIKFKVGNKYIKVFSEGGSVWGFVVNTDNDKKFKKGDLLKAAGYSAPTRNFARGNILEGGYTSRWTGA